MSLTTVSDTSFPLEQIKSILYEQKLIPSLDFDIDLKQFSNGYSNLTYLLSTPAKDFVLRRPPEGAIKRGHDMGREYKVLSQLSKHFEKAPQPYYFEKESEPLGFSFYIMEKVDGVVLTLSEAQQRQLAPSDFKDIADSWMDSFVEFHQLDYKAVGLEDLGRPNGYVERQVTNWAKQYYKAATQELPTADFVVKWMSENQPKHYDHTLVHNDFKYDNLVYEENQWNKVNAILDWEMCTLGDPLMDLGTSLAYWVMENDGATYAKTIPSPTILPGNPDRLEVVEAYSQKSGRSIDNLIFYYAFGLFKLAVIAQQIYYRYDKGLTQNKKFAQLDQVCAFLCLTAQQAIQKRKIVNLF